MIHTWMHMWIQQCCSDLFVIVLVFHHRQSVRTCPAGTVLDSTKKGWEYLHLEWILLLMLISLHTFALKDHTTILIHVAHLNSSFIGFTYFLSLRAAVFIHYRMVWKSTWIGRPMNSVCCKQVLVSLLVKVTVNYCCMLIELQIDLKGFGWIC